MEKIKELRDKTGAGMMDCKKALEEAGGDIEKAVEILRKKGIAKAAKREGRETSEGLIVLKTSDDKKKGYMLEVNAETDFVARNEKFREFTDKALEILAEKEPKTLEELLALPMGEMSVRETIDNLSGTIGEKMAVKGCATLESNGTVAAYSHMGGAIGVLVALSDEGKDDLAHDIALQIAAANPVCLDPGEVDDSVLDKEKEIYREQLIKEGKPESILDKIIEGKINKFYDEVCLNRQEFIKEEKKKVSDILGDTKIEKFIRYSLK